MMLAIGALALGLTMSAQQMHRVDAAMLEVMTRAHIAGMSIGIAQNGRMLYARGYGMADVRTGRAAGSQTVYEIGSLTKQFTAACALRLIAERRLSLDDPVARYAPTLAKAAAVTVRQLLNQTSGIADYSEDPDFSRWGKGALSHAQVLTHVENLDLHFVPGSKFEYSNTNYFLLGMIVESVSGQSYADYLEQHILGPLHLVSTAYADSNATNEPDRAGGSSWSGEAFVPAGVPSFGTAFSAGGLSSNVADLTAWDAALLNGRVLPAAVTRLMTTPGLLNGTATAPYGMGLALSHVYGRPVVMHTGAIGSFSAFTGTALPALLEVTVLTNTSGVDTTPIAKTIFAIADPPDPSAVAVTGFTPAQNELPAITSLLRSILTSLRNGDVDRSLLTAQFQASLSAAWIADRSAALEKAGPAQAYDFNGSSARNGAIAYRYNVRFAADSWLVTIAIAPSGKVDALSVTPPI
ncbi:MAG: beta-lactamase family protein [Candidatus Eremiobacteraeota bacterium]|nr:beta-lactamase family protein [Candidatus Eremiobacteraeota bacterium]